MKQPGLDGRHRDRDGRIDLKHSNTLNKHLLPPIPEFGLDVTLKEMREATGKISESDVRTEAKRLAALRLPSREVHHRAVPSGPCNPRGKEASGGSRAQPREDVHRDTTSRRGSTPR